MKNVKFGSALIGTLLGIAAGTLAYVPEAPATEQSKQRQEGRDVKQDTRQESRQEKVDCRAENQKSNPACRQDKRENKAEGRQEARDIKY